MKRRELLPMLPPELLANADQRVAQIRDVVDAMIADAGPLTDNPTMDMIGLSAFDVIDAAEKIAPSQLEAVLAAIAGDLLYRLLKDRTDGE